MFVLPVTILILLIIGWVSFYFSNKALKGFRKHNMKYSMAAAVAIFLFSFSVLTSIICALILSQITLGR